MKETELWLLMNQSMGNLWVAQRHEDKYSPDIPDVSYTYRGRSGWIELKASTRVGDAPISIPKLRAGQLNWLHARARHGAPAWVVWFTGKIVLILPAARIAEWDEARTMAEWEELAVAKPRPLPLEMQIAMKNSLDKTL